MIDNNFEESREAYPLPTVAETTTNDAEETDEEDFEWEDSWLDVRASVRVDIDTAIAVYSFLEEIDLQSPEVLRWKLTRKLLQTKKNCLLILMDGISQLAPEKEEGEED